MEEHEDDVRRKQSDVKQLRSRTPVPLFNEHRKILVADDKYLNLLQTKEILEELRVYLEVVCVADGQSAIDEIANSDMKTFVLILLDQYMPLKTGLQALKEIKNLYRDANVIMPKTAFISGYIDRDLRRKGKKLGVKDFL